MFFHKFMYYTLMQSRMSTKRKGLPIGTIIINKGKVLCSRYNGKIKNNIFEHAEMKIINSVKKNIKILSSFKIYTTLEPCSNCINIIRHSKLKYLKFIVSNQFLFISKLSDKYKNFLSNKKILIFKNYFLNKRICR